MPDIMQDFIKSCLELGEELLEKENLTEKESNFLNKLNIIVDQGIKK